MTVRVETLKGSTAGAYYVDGPADYYLQSDEPRGLWHGDAATTLGLSGEVSDEHFLALMAGMDPLQPDRHLGRGYDEKSVRGFDVTASAPKSVSVMFALGDADTRHEVLAAHDASVTALAGWIERHAHTRFRIGGDVAIVDAKGIVAAAFRQHTSRALDPQLHTHLVIPNRVMSPDGRWLALDARLIKLDQQSLSAIYHAGLRSELTRRLGVRWHQPEHGIAEIRDVPDPVLVEFSARTADVRRRTDEKLNRFIDTMEREPSPRERWQLEREAAIDSRPAKAKSVNADALHQAWTEQTSRLGFDPHYVVADSLGRATPRGIGNDTRQTMIEQTVDAMSEKQSTWRPTQLHRELAAVVPTETAATAEQLVDWLDRVVDEISATRCVDVSKPIPSDSMLRRDGRPITESVVDRALTTQAILDQEQSLIEWADHGLSYDDDPDEPAAIKRSLVELDVEQASVAAAVAGHADLVLVVGPAGTGKTTALRPAVEQLHADRRHAFGVAPSATAAQVLADETGIAADTLDKLLIEHRLNRPPDPKYDLPAGSTVIVDEAGMTPTGKLAELVDLAVNKGWRVALVGDPMQFSAVGRGGMFGMLVDTFGGIELEKVHRFTNDWERDASLRLRRGDVTAADDYDQHRRLHGGTAGQMERRVVARWSELRAAGKSTLLMSPTNETAERLNIRCQQSLIKSGEINPDWPSVQAGAYTVYAGDEIATRHNDRQLLTDRGTTVKNRATWTVEGICNDGSLIAIGKSGRIWLPADYVTEHVDLAYASTGMGGQARTVKTGILYADRPTDIRNLYVSMSRGTETNEAFLVTAGEETALDVFVRDMTTDWIDRPALSSEAELNNTEVHRPGLLDSDELRRLMEERYEIAEHIRDADERLRSATQQGARFERERTDAASSLAFHVAALDKARGDLERFDRPLRRSRHIIQIENAQYARVVEPVLIGELKHTVAQLDQRIAAAREEATAAEASLAERASLTAALTEIDARLTADREARLRVVSRSQSAVVVEVLGHRPDERGEAHEWGLAAAQLSQHQAAFGIDHGLGGEPSRGERSAYAQSFDDLDRKRPSRPRPVQVHALRPEGPGVEL
ncbi:MAG: conjugal transfer protein [Ilumatobacteraceae bacterium]|nr:conjugal transfer protein [Ilumatobacteraceae bacterium]